jgi:hypothetical protein
MASCSDSRTLRGSRALLAVGILLLGSPEPAHTLECGDFDQSGSVGSSDALRVLRAATAQAADLYCPCVTSTSTLGPQGLIAECFGDEACTDPEEPYCDGNQCSECSRDEHCPDGWACDHGLYRCTPVGGFECGDVDWSGVIRASDALRVLRISIGLVGQLYCPPCVASTTSTT